MNKPLFSLFFIKPSHFSYGRVQITLKNILRNQGLVRLKYRSVTTWSSLATAFNEKNKEKNLSALFSNNSTGLFGRPELHSPEGFDLLKENASREADILVDEAVSSNRKRKMVQIFDDLSDTLCQVADMAEFVRVGHPKQRFAIAAEDACLDVNSTVEKLNTNILLYKSLQKVVQNGDIMATDEIDKHVAELFLFDFEQSGIHLDKKRRERVVDLNDYTLRLGTYFVQGSLQARLIPKSAFPGHLSNCFADMGENIQIGSLFADSHDEMLRETAYRAFLYPDEHQEQLLTNLLATRNELAVLCGFPTYAHRAVMGSLAGEPKVVSEFLEILSTELKPRAEGDYNAMLNLKKKTSSRPNELNAWDIPYYTAIAKQEKFNLRGSDYCPYFSLGACMEGLDLLFQSLYGITLKVEVMNRSEAWHEDVVKLGVYDDSGILGYIYCDFIEREGKPNQDCHFTIRGGRLLPDDSYQLPIVTVLLNLPAPNRRSPTLLTPSMLDNLFHEMGHAMHSMLARTKYQHVTGTRCATDLAEVPSILMEYFASDPRVVSTFARHYQTQEPIPIHLLGNLAAAKKFFSASECQLQVFYAALDHSLHSGVAEGASSNLDILEEVQNRFYGLKYVPNTAWHLRFGHLVGYGAKYYSYLMSRAVASWIWHQCFVEDPFSKEVGLRYRNMVLAHGGSKPPKILLQDFLNQEMTPHSLAQALLIDLDRK